MRLVIKKEKLIFVVLTLIIRCLMDYIYISYLTTRWAYQGFLLDINFGKVITSYLMLLFFISFLKEYQKDRFSHFLALLFFFTMYIPVGVIYGLMNMNSTFFIIVNVSFILLCVAIIFFNKEYKHVKRNRINLYSKFYWTINLISIMTFIIMTAQNFRNINLGAVINLADVYSVRQNATYYWGMNYFFNWQTKVLNPYMIAIAHVTKKKVVKLAYILFQIWLYILTGHKMVLFTLVIIFIILKFKHKLYNIHLFFAKGLSLVFLISSVEILVLKSSYLIDFFIRRIIYVPALLSFYYYEYFREYGFQFWKYTMVGRLLNVQTDFQVAPSFMIGEKYFNNITTNAVTGYLGSEYMNGGFVGVILATLILIVLFKKIDKFSEQIGKDIVLITLLTPIYTLWNTALSTALLTGGVILGIAILYQTRVIYTSESLE